MVMFCIEQVMVIKCIAYYSCVINALFVQLNNKLIRGLLNCNKHQWMWVEITTSTQPPMSLMPVVVP